MNRGDEIQAAARNAAQWVTADPEQRNVLADDLIKLVALFVMATGKAVASEGESSISDDEDESAHARYLVGESLQNGARWAQEESVGADLERYARDGLTPAWTPSLAPEGKLAGVGMCDVLSSKYERRGATLADLQNKMLAELENKMREVTAQRDAALAEQDSLRERIRNLAAVSAKLRTTCDEALAERDKLIRWREEDAQQAAKKSRSVWTADQSAAVQQQPPQTCVYLPNEGTPSCDFDPSCPTHGIMPEPS